MTEIKIGENAHVITDALYDSFCKEALYWIKKYGMLQYEWFFEHKEIEERAMAVHNVDAKIAYLVLSTQWDVEPTPKRIRHAAFHEVWEVFLGYIATLAISRDFNENLLECEIHSVIRTMENTHFVDDYVRRFSGGKKKA